MAKTLPLSEPLIGKTAWRRVKECLDSGWVSSVGPMVGRFEDRVARMTGAKHAVAAVNGTAALHLALKGVGVGPGDAVITPAMSFIATANAAVYCGAEPLFVDCDTVRFNLDPDVLESFLKKQCVRRKGGVFTRREGRQVKAVMVTHVLGFPAEISRLARVVLPWGLALIEDAAEAVGSYWGSRHAGTFGAAGVLSFNGNKVITSGGGGMLLTNSGSLAQRVKHLSEQAKTEGLEYVHDEVGFNYRLTNISAALGLSQLDDLKDLLRRRQRIGRWYREELVETPVEPVPHHVVWNRWLLAVETTGPREKERLLKTLRSAGILARPLWRPLPLLKPYAHCLSTTISGAKRAYDRIVNIPTSPHMTRTDVARVGRVLRKAALVRALL